MEDFDKRWEVNTMLKGSVSEMIGKLHELKMQQNEICQELTSQVTKEPIIMAALKEGLIRLNFPTPPGFYRLINRNH